MFSKLKFYYSFVIVLSVLFVGCEQVNELTDTTAIDKFEVIDLSPSNIQLGEIVLNKDTVIIPVIRGKGLFPMTLSVKITPSSNTDKVLFGKSFDSFENIPFTLEDVELKKFYLISKSGKANPYYLKLKISDQSEKNDILFFRSNSYPKIAPVSYINYAERKINVLLLKSLAFPFEFPVKIQLVDSASLFYKNELVSENDGIWNPKLTFASLDSTQTLVVKAQDLKPSNWIVSLKQIEEVDENTSENILKLVTVNKINPEINNEGMAIYSTEIKDDSVFFNLRIDSEDILFENMQIAPNVELNKNSQMLRLAKGQFVNFTNLQTVFSDTIIDNFSGNYKVWHFKVKAYGIQNMTDVTKFDFTYRDNYKDGKKTLIGSPIIDNLKAEITLPLEVYFTSGIYWPLNLFFVSTNSISLSKNAKQDLITSSQLEVQFANIDDVKNFDVTYTDPVTKTQTARTWNIKLKKATVASSENKVLEFKVKSSSIVFANELLGAINDVDNTIVLSANEAISYPWRFIPEITVSQYASIDGIESGDMLEFKSADDALTFDVLAQDGSRREWKIIFRNSVQLLNSDFEYWLNNGNIDPMPGVGRGWCSANAKIGNMGVAGTNKVEHNGGYAAEMTTEVTPSSGLGPKNLMTSGALFLGRFTIDINQLNKPKMMTFFGVPFSVAPKQLKLDLKYMPAVTLQKSEWEKGSGISAVYKLETISGEDEGHIWIELLHYTGNDLSAYEYHGDPKDDIVVLARGEYTPTKGENTDWSRVAIDIMKNENFAKYKATHIVIAMASSKKGDEFIGGIGSKLTVDNVELVY